MRAALAFLLLLLAALGLGQAKFDTERFDASFDIASNGIVSVTETISVNFRERQHGLIRKIPFRTRSSAGAVRTVRISVEGVEANGSPTKAQGKQDGGDFSIRIGSADAWVNGHVQYEIKYTIDGAITPIEKADELGKRTEFFWNLLPTNWPTDIPASTMTVTFPQPEAGRLVARVLAGPKGTKKGIQVEAGKPDVGRSDLIDVALKGNAVVVSLKDPLPSGQVVTAAVALPGNTVSPRVPIIQRPRTRKSLDVPEGSPWLGLIAAFPGVLVFFLARRLWPARERPLVVKFDAPPGIGPSLSGTIIDGQVNPRDVVAGIVSLAQKGALKLHHPEQEGAGIQIELLGIERVRGLDYSEQSLYAGLSEYGDLVTSEMLRGSFGAKYQHTQALLMQDALERGLFTERSKLVGGFGCLLVALTLLTVGGLCIFQPVFTVLGAVFSVIVGAIAISKVSYVTPQGQLVRRELQGLKEFITRANKDELNYMAKVDPNQALFEKLLPYAIAFDAVQQWTQAFQGIDLQMPDWYDAPMYGAGDIFWTTMLFNDLTYFGRDYGDAMSYSPPTDFGTGGGFSSGDSAFGGDGGGGWSDSGGGGFDGGFSGGDGGGGGGGDSW